MIVYKSCAAAGGDKEQKIGSPYRFDSCVAPACLELCKGKIVWSCSLSARRYPRTSAPGDKELLKGPAGTKRFTATGRTALKGKELQLTLGQCSNSSCARFLEKAVRKSNHG